MRMPRAFVITFAVAMRFFPTVKEEVSHVRDAISLRGIGFSLRNLRLRPALVFEGFITPLLVRASTIAEELSAASITRGLDNPAPRTAFIKLGITFKDICLTFIFAAILIELIIHSKFYDDFSDDYIRIKRTLQVLSRRKKNNPVFVGDPGVGKTAVAEGLVPH